VEVNYLLLPDIPSFFAQVELRDGHLVHLHCLHPLPPHVSVSTTHRDAELVLVGRRVRRERTPCIVAGDLNDVAWSYTTTLFQKVSGMLDPRKGRGFYNTFHARWPILRWPLDHLFHSPSFRFVELERLSPIGSDHFPILAGLSFEPEGADRQSPPEMNPEDRQMARRKLRKAGEEGLTGG
jgi:endonuclease/exonuclease/phosphatase (EEP) superfamily protein YafD